MEGQVDQGGREDLSAPVPPPVPSSDRDTGRMYDTVIEPRRGDTEPLSLAKEPALRKEPELRKEPDASGTPASRAAPLPSLREDASGPSTTLVIEDGVIPRRLRRPIDVLRLLLALLLIAGVGLIAYYAQSTASGIDQDISSISQDLPNWLVYALNVVGGLGLIALPVATAIDMVVRHRSRQLLDAVIGILATVALLLGAIVLIERTADERLLLALSGSADPTRGDPFSPVLGGLVAYITVARLISRSRWNVLASVVVGSLSVLTFLTGGITVAGIALSVLIGWAAGLVIRYALGTPTTRPSGMEVAGALEQAGYPLTVLRASQSTEQGRRYVATTRGGTQLEVVVLDRDLEGAGIASVVWRSLRLRDSGSGGAFSLRRTLEHDALMGYAAQLSGAPTPRLLATSEVGRDAAVLAYERLAGTRFSDLEPDELTDDDLDGAFRAVRLLHEDRLAHGALTASHLIRDPLGHIWLLDIARGEIASSDLARRIDIAELLCTLALRTDPARAVASGRRVMGVDGLARALPVLQPVALSSDTRRALRKHKKTLVTLRDSLTELVPDRSVESVNLERLKPRTIVMIAVGAVALYVLIPQIASVNLANLITNAQWPWVIAAIGASLITYAGATMSLEGFVPERLNFLRTTLAQLAGNFATLVTPPTLGTVAINLRYLQKAGVHPALAAASVGVSQVAAFFVHLGLITVVAVVAGRNADVGLEIPRWAIYAVGILIIVGLIVSALPPIRRLITARVLPTLKQVLPRLITVAQQPLKLATGIGGMLLLNLAFCLCMYCCVHAFGGELGFATIAFVYLAGATVGQAAPTPGGIGAVEAVLSAGLIAAGLDSGVAFSSVLLFRLITFWLPTIPGYFSLHHLQKIGAL